MQTEGQNPCNNCDLGILAVNFRGVAVNYILYSVYLFAHDFLLVCEVQFENLWRCNLKEMSWFAFWAYFFWKEELPERIVSLQIRNPTKFCMPACKLTTDQAFTKANKYEHFELMLHFPEGTTFQHMNEID